DICFSHVGLLLVSKDEKDTKDEKDKVTLLSGCGDLSLVEDCEGLALFRKRLQQRRRLPQVSVLRMKLADTIVDALQPNRVREPHRTAAPSREAVAIDVNDVDVHGSQREALLENLRAFIHQSIHGSFDNFLFADLAPGDSCFGCCLLDQLLYFGIRVRFSILIVAIPAGAGLLSKPAQLAQPVADHRMPDVGIFEMLVLLTNAPADVEPS